MAGGSSKQDRAQQKALEKQKQKILEDKTFGLKNKKGKSVQKYIKSVQQQITGKPPANSDKYISEQNRVKAEKQKMSQQQALLASLFKGTENIKSVAVDQNKPAYDPKQSKVDQRIDLYCDQRDQRVKNDDDDMTNWDLNTLERVVRERHSSDACATDIICKYFLNAVETRKYGWFWVCPNGGDKCKYRHCLPPGFVLKTDVPKEVEEDEETLEERIERQRAELPPGGEMVTAESLARWRASKEEDRLESLKDSMQKGSQVQLTGKDLFTFNPSLFLDDDCAADDLDYDDDVDIDEIIKENEMSLKTGNVLPNGDRVDAEEDLDSVDISKLSI